MFLDACETASRICRCLCLEQGNCLILGSGGKGRNSLARIGCYLSGHKMFDAGVNIEYTKRLWNEDLKKVAMLCGIDNEKIGILLIYFLLFDFSPRFFIL